MSDLETVFREIQDVNARAAEICSPLSSQQMLWRPGPKRWCIAEIFAHLETTTRTFLPALDAAIAQARRDGRYSQGPFDIGWKGRLFVWYVEPPPKLRLPAPKPLRPVVVAEPQEVLPSFLATQQLVVDRVKAAAGLDLNRAIFISPLNSFIRMNLLAVFKVFTSHERRHFWQAHEVLTAMHSK